MNHDSDRQDAEIEPTVIVFPTDVVRRARAGFAVRTGVRAGAKTHDKTLRSFDGEGND